jgi:hypothetical protein
MQPYVILFIMSNVTLYKHLTEAFGELSFKWCGLDEGCIMSARSVGARTSLDTSRPSFECRVYERQPCEIPAKCHPASLLDMKDAGWDGLILDISQGGVRIRLRRRFERGTGLALELLNDPNQDSTVAFVKVVHLKREDDGGYILGCQFLSALSEEEVNRLIGKQELQHEEIEVAKIAEDDIPWADILDDEVIETAELAEEQEIILAELAEDEEILTAELADEPVASKSSRKKRVG